MISKTATIHHVKLEEAKNQLRLDADFIDDDDRVNSMILAATNLAENYIEMPISKTTCVMTLFDFAGDTIIVPEGNYISLTSVVDGDSNEFTKDILKVYQDHFEIVLTESIDVDQLVITFEAGYEEDSCPEAIKQAILIKVVDLYDTERGSFTLPLKNNNTFHMVLNYYKPFRMSHIREQ